MAWLKNFKTKLPIPASQLKWSSDNADTRSVADVVNAKIDIDTVFPVGSIYLNATNVDPAELFGGTWLKMTDRFLLGAGGNYALGAVGGEATHKLTVNELPKHSHGIGYGTNTVGGSSPKPSALSGDPTSNLTSEAGGDDPHNNMPPFVAVNMWQRIA